MVYLEITMTIPASKRPAASRVYETYKAAFLTTVKGAKSKELYVRDEDVQVLHGFDTVDHANAYLKSPLFTADVVGALSPLLDGPPDIRVYKPAA